MNEIKYLKNNKKLMKEWDWKKNINLKPDLLTIGSGKKVWWICKTCGHNWETTIYTRSKGSSCPYCSGRFAVEGKNDLATLYPDLIKEWDYEKNAMEPNKIGKNYSKKVWWTCSKCGYEWEARISKRSYGAGCPYCSNRKTLNGYNDLTTTNPTILEYWNYKKKW